MLWCHASKNVNYDLDNSIKLMWVGRGQNPLTSKIVFETKILLLTDNSFVFILFSINILLFLLFRFIVSVYSTNERIITAKYNTWMGYVCGAGAFFNNQRLVE